MAQRSIQAMAERRGFDYIIIGAGAAGCVVANRLSADPSVSVALIEAGPSDREFPVNVKTTLPIGNIFLLPHDKYNWGHEFRGGQGVYGRNIPCPRGKLYGGCTSVNGTVYIRGHHCDYDHWAELGNEGWRYSEVLTAFKRHENRTGSASIFHSAGGELDVQRPAANNPLAHAFVNAALEAGYPRNDDFNGESQDGFGLFELNQRSGMRLSSSRAFLHPARRRTNLHIYADTLVERIDIRSGRATGITVIHQGRRRQLAASSEIILSGGAVNSPQLLLLSGIGPATGLRRHGIPIMRELPGVGANLQDHPTVPVAMLNPTAESYALSLQSASRIALAPLRYLFLREGMLASNVAEAGGFMRTMPSLDRPDVQITYMVGMKDNPKRVPRKHGFAVLVSVLRASTRGYLELSSTDPAARPFMYPQFLEDRADVETLLRGLKETRRILSMPAMVKFAGTEVMPGDLVTSDTDLESFIRSNVATTHHIAGTCKMGPERDPMAVVDAQLRVHGIEGLRIADASIMPNIIGGNTAAPSMMIGERAAEFIVNGIHHRNGVAAARSA